MEKIFKYIKYLIIISILPPLLSTNSYADTQNVDTKCPSLPIFFIASVAVELPKGCSAFLGINLNVGSADILEPKYPSLPDKRNEPQSLSLKPRTIPNKLDYQIEVNIK